VGGKVMSKNNSPGRAIREYLRSDLKKYMLTIGELTPEEKKDLLKWVAAGNSVYDNPCSLYCEKGYPMDYITAIRIEANMYEDHINSTGNYRWGDFEEVNFEAFTR
jgi:hypothetical protein